jgi:SAM-dependent methyltransferase
VSGFSAEWLGLREAADHRARDGGLLAALAAHFAGRGAVKLVDLGCGTGSNLRALAPILPARQHWRLVDHDAALLEAARGQIAAWAEGAGIPGLTVEFEIADLRDDLGRALAGEADLVTAAALFDLVSAEWIDRFAALLARRPCAFHTVLIYNGEMRWRPAHSADAAIAAAFNAHQRLDKGFGPAAGPDAPRILAEKLETAGYRVTAAPSPWRLTGEDRPLIAAVSDGIAQAARETGRLAETEIAAWLATRGALTACEIGHVDLLALPR